MGDSMVILCTSPQYVKVNVSNSKNDSVAFEKKFPKDITVAQLKKMLEIVTGGNAGSMHLELYNGERLVAKIENNDALVGSLPIETGMRLHVIDNFSWMSEESVEKFELTEDQYEKKSDTVRNFLKKNRLGKYNDEEMKELEEKKKQQADKMLQKAQLCTIGSRCQVTVKDAPIRRGTIMYNGPIDGKKGIFIGVKYDEPVGRNDGCIDGKRYFECASKYGGFVVPSAVEVGQFALEEDGLEDEL